MKKRVLILVVIALVAVASLAVVMAQRQKTPSSNVPTAAEALRDAKNYDSGDKICTQSFVPATHTKTGAKYIFPNGCLPDGWVADSP